MPDPSQGAPAPDVVVVDTRGGTRPHLAWTPGDVTFCGLAVDRPSRTWFELTGCRKCARAGRAHGLVEVTDVGGRRVPL